jgi:hypothetical protein
MRKVVVLAQVKITLNVDEGVEISELMSGLECVLQDDDNGNVDDTEIVDYEVADSK